MQLIHFEPIPEMTLAQINILLTVLSENESFHENIELPKPVFDQKESYDAKNTRLIEDLKRISGKQIREILEELHPSTLVDFARAVHGRLYKVLGEGYKHKHKEYKK